VPLLSHATCAVLALATLALAVPATVTAADPAGRQLYAEPSPLAALIDALPGLPDEARLDLAAIIVEGLVAAYETELDRAMEDGRRRGASERDLARWAQGIAPILDELMAWQADLYVAQQVEVRVERHNQIVLMIDGRPLWIAWPRISARSALERDLATEFCRRHECPGEILAGTVARAAAPSAAQGTWRLSQFQPPTWESAAGVNCEFPDYARLGEHEQVCRDVVTDLHALAAALRAAWRGGEQVEWGRLGLRAGTSDGRHQVTVNRRGDYIAVYVPALAAQPIDWREAGRWLQAAVEGRSVTATVLRASP
jgi:hypothetical protein